MCYRWPGIVSTVSANTVAFQIICDH